MNTYVHVHTAMILLCIFFCSILRGQLLLNYPEVEGLCLELYAKNIRSPFLLGMLVEVFKEKATEMTDTSTRQTYLDKATNVQ